MDEISNESLEGLRFVFEHVGQNQKKVIAVLKRHPTGMLGTKLRELTGLKPGQASAAYRGLEARGLLIRTHTAKPPYCVHVQLSDVALEYFGEGKF